MKKKEYNLAATFVLMLLAPLVSTATPITFDFTTPDWQTNSDPGLFGTALDLSITVDNGSSSALNQDYNFSNISSVYIVAINGSFTDTVSTYSFSDNYPVISTDALGHPTLQIGHQNNSQGYWLGSTFDDVTFFALSQVDDSGSGSHPVYIGNGPDSYAYIDAGQNDPPMIITQAPARTVPEPATLALLGLGLVGIGISRKKQRLG